MDNNLNVTILNNRLDWLINERKKLIKLLLQGEDVTFELEHANGQIEALHFVIGVIEGMDA